MTHVIELYTTWMEAGGYSQRYVNDRRYILHSTDRALHRTTGHGILDATEMDLAARLSRRTRRGLDLRPGSRRVEHLAINQFLDWAHAHGYAPTNAGAGLRKPRAPRTIIRPPTDEDVAEILAQAAEPWRTYAVLAAFNGLRCCSIADLRREDVTAEEIYVRTKGGRTIVLDTDPASWEAVRDLPPGRIAVSAGGRADERWISRGARRHFHRRLRVPVSMHGLRRWYATALDAQGEDLLTIRDALGHAHVSTTQLYIVRSRRGRRRLRIQTPPGHAATS